MFEDLKSWTLVYYVSEWLIRLVMLFYVPQRRLPAAARSWLLLIFILPWPGLILYAFFGRAYPTPHRAALHRLAVEKFHSAGRELLPRPLDPDQLPPDVRSTALLSQNLGLFGPLGGNRLELLTDYQGSVRRLVEDIDAARAHVHLLYYIFADDATGHTVANALGRAVKRGVKCRVLIDTLGSKRWLSGIEARLTTQGVEVHTLLPYRWYRPSKGRMDLRNHRKIAVIDCCVGYVGSQNLVDADFKPGIIYEELVVRAAGPIAAHLQAIFLADRFFETENAPIDRVVFPAIEAAGDSQAQVLPSGPGFPQANNQRMFVNLILSARKRVVLTTPYFIPDEGLLQALEIAVKRGVEVHLVVSRISDQLLVGMAQRSYYEQLLEIGVRLHRYHERLLHAKHMSVDETVAVIGSSNMDIRSFLLNAEVSLLIYDPKIVAQLNAVQERYFTQSDLLTAEEWRKRPLRVRVMQNTARLVDSLL
jgi:cardiolipin synthase